MLLPYTRYDVRVASTRRRAVMWRKRALRVVLVLVGLLFSAAIYPAIGGIRDPAHSDTGDTMMMSLYFALGIFLLIAVRNPSAHRSLIAFAAWSGFAHAATMSRSEEHTSELQSRGHLVCRLLLEK